MKILTILIIVIIAAVTMTACEGQNEYTGYIDGVGNVRVIIGENATEPAPDIQGGEMIDTSEDNHHGGVREPGRGYGTYIFLDNGVVYVMRSKELPVITGDNYRLKDYYIREAFGELWYYPGDTIEVARTGARVVEY